ncbi:MAG: protein kinase [Gemmatales bacterium]|nr:protein kinase [Gemmatales bacterium]MCS7160472.1 protein kinase [Gemmatales bacterium]MDW8175672.1 protein kinase [Gemmatales bacterium]MDW8222471.1 protein kinase [Gemmatales bacterium]
MASGRHSSTRWSTLPLPLVQLLRASECAKTAAERFFFARQLWETTIRLVGSICLASWAQRQGQESNPASGFPSLWRLDSEEAGSLALQSPLAGWWRWVRLLLPGLCNSNDPVAVRLRDWLHGECSLQDTCSLSSLQQLLALPSPTSLPRTPAAWLEHYVLAAPALAAFEPGAPDPQEWDSKSQALVQTWAQLLASGSFFELIRWVFLARVEQEGEGTYRLARLDLSGKSPRWLPPLVLTGAENEGLPSPGRLYLELSTSFPGNSYLLSHSGPLHDSLRPWAALPLYPLVLYRFDTEETLFLHGISGEQEALYVAAVSGYFTCDTGASEPVLKILTQLRQHPATNDLAQKWLTPIAANPGDSAMGHRFGARQSAGFELLSEWPCGSDTVQYRAWQISLRRPVRLQCRIFSEGRPAFPEEELSVLYALRKLSDKHLIKVYEHGISEKVAYIVTELVPGVSLARVLEKLPLNGSKTLPSSQDWYQALRLASQEETRNERPLCDLHTYERRLARYLATPHCTDPGSAAASRNDSQSYIRIILSLMSRLAEGVHALHEMGLAHGNIVPGRIILAHEDGRPVLLEPSYRHDISGSGDLTQSLRFLSPERRAGGTRITPQSDIYSLAALTFELLALPLERVPLHEAASHYPLAAESPLFAELISFLSRGVSRNPEERPDSAVSFAQQLQQFAQRLCCSDGTEPSVSCPSADAKSQQSPTPSAATSPSRAPGVAWPNDTRPPRRRQFWMPALTLLCVCLVVIPATFYALAWWLGLQPLDLLRLVSQRTLGHWFALSEPATASSTGANSTSSVPTSMPTTEQETVPASSTLVSDKYQETLARLENQLTAERQRAEELLAKLTQQTQQLNQERARTAQLEKLLATNNQDELLLRLREEIQQHQANLELAQQRYQSAQEEIAQLNKQLQLRLTSEKELRQNEKQLREELAALTLKMETLLAEIQTLRAAQHRPFDLSPSFVQQWFRVSLSPAARQPLARQARRPQMIVFRDTLAERLKNLDLKELSPWSLASAYLMLGLLEHDLGAYEPAQTAYKEAWNILNRLPADARQSPEYKPLTYAVHAATARLCQEHKKYAEAEAAWLQALSNAESLSKETNAQERWSGELASCHEHLATLYRHSRQLDKAESAYRNALTLWEKLHQQRVEEALYVLGMARCHQGLAALAEWRDQVPVAEQHYKQAVALLENLLARPSPSSDFSLLLAQVLTERAALYRDAGQVEQALADFHRAVELGHSLPNSDALSFEVAATLRDAYAGRAHTYMELRRYPDALRDWEDALAWDWERLPNLRAYRAICLARLGEIQRAVAETQRLSREHQKTGSLLYNLACVHAVLAETVSQDQKLTPSEQSRLRETHASQAVELLRQAADLGYFRSSSRLQYLQHDQDLDALRQRDDFKQLLEKLSAQP